MVFACDFLRGWELAGGGVEEEEEGESGGDKGVLRRRSKKLVAAALIAIKYWPFVGTGSGRFTTLSSSGP